MSLAPHGQIGAGQHLSTLRVQLSPATESSDRGFPSRLVSRAGLVAVAPPLFPLWALPPKIRAAVEEAVEMSMAPCPLVASSALAAASLAVQAKYDVRRFNGLVSPCSLNFITFAESGERKTTVDRFFFNAFGEFEESMEHVGQERDSSSIAEGGDA